MGPRNKQQIAREHNLACSRNVLAAKRQADDIRQADLLNLSKELQDRNEEIKQLQLQHDETLRELKKLKSYLDNQHQFIEFCRQLGQPSADIAITMKPREISDYNELQMRQQQNRQQILRNLAIKSGLAKSDEGYQALIRGALPKADQIYLRTMHDEDTILSDSEVEEEWLLSDLSSNEIHRSKQYITYSNEDKVFVLESLDQCQTNSQILVGISQLIEIFPKYYGLTPRKIISWRKIRDGNTDI
jgi:hypothetical protein